MMRKICYLSFFALVMSSAYGQFTESFVEGFIIDQYGGKYNGYMRISRYKKFNKGVKGQSETLVYRETSKSKKEKLTVNDLSAFKMGEDSFLILKNFQLPLDETKHNKFAKVILKGKDDILCSFEELKLVAGVVQLNNYVAKTINHYLIYRKGKFINITEYNFYNEMPLIVSDYKELKDQIETKVFKFKDIDRVAFEYELWRKTGREGREGVWWREKAPSTYQQ